MAVKRVVTGRVRLSYAKLFEAEAFEGGKPKYSTAIIIPKDDTVTVNKIKAAIKQALEDGRVKNFKGKIPKVFTNPLRDGDEERGDDENYENSYFMNVRSERRPQVVDRDLNPILDPEEIYSGCYARVSLSPYSFNTAGNQGVSFGLDNVQKLADGEPLGAPRAKAENDFEPIEDEDLM